MLTNLTTSEPDCTGNDEDPHSGLQRIRQVGHMMVDPMLEWQEIGMIIDCLNDAFRTLEKDSGGAEVVVRGTEAHDEIARKQVVPQHRVHTVGSIKMFANGVAVYPM